MAVETTMPWSVRGSYTFSSDAVPVPHCDLIISVAEMLHQVDGGLGYVIFDDLAEELGLALSKAFQVALMHAVWNEMIRRQWNPCERSQARLNMFEANDGFLPVEIVGDTVTYKKLHFDPHSIVFAHLYQAPENLQGGAISLTNVRGYLTDTGLGFEEVFRPSQRRGHKLRMVARDEHRDILLRKYATMVQPPEEGKLLLVVVRNDPVVGVAHEIARVHVIDPEMPTARRFYRTSISPLH